MAQLIVIAMLSLVLPQAANAQAPVGDRDDQFVATGCVARGEFRTAGPHSILVWSKGDVYLTRVDVRFRPSQSARPVGTAGDFMPVFYWIDDEDDFSRYVGRQVEIVGELSDELRKGEVEFDHDGDFTEIEFDAGGREAKARVPTSWLGPQTRGREFDTDVVVRTVDVEKVTVIGPCR